MSPDQDSTINCKTCQQDFVFTDGERKFYESKGFQIPKKCKPCRELAKQQRGGDTGYNQSGGYNARPPASTGPSNTAGSLDESTTYTDRGRSKRRDRDDDGGW